MLTILPLPAFNDNYIWLIHNGNEAAVVDPGDALVVQRFCTEHNLQLKEIWLTHHHADHTGGVAELLAQFHPQVYGPSRCKMSHNYHSLDEAQAFFSQLCQTDVKVLQVPGHTRDHLAFYLEHQALENNALFCGDTLFSAGCGRLFEGTPEQMFDSLNRIAQFSPQTAVYCAHEYTLSNLKFARFIEPDNPDLSAYQKQVEQMRAKGQPSLPSSIGIELKINPFLRCDELKPLVEQRVGKTLPNDVQVFTQLRQLKDSF